MVISLVRVFSKYQTKVFDSFYLYCFEIVYCKLFIDYKKHFGSFNNYYEYIFALLSGEDILTILKDHQI